VPVGRGLGLHYYMGSWIYLGGTWIVKAGGDVTEGEGRMYCSRSWEGY